jgi:hypothetical protein
MKNINQYNYFRLLLFTCFIGILLGTITGSIKIFYGIDIYNSCSPLIWNLINAFLIIFTLFILNKTGKDKFLLKK